MMKTCEPGGISGLSASFETLVECAAAYCVCVISSASSGLANLFLDARDEQSIRDADDRGAREIARRRIDVAYYSQVPPVCTIHISVFGELIISNGIQK